MIARYAIPFFIVMGLFVGPLLVYFLCRSLLPRRYARKTGAALAAIVILLIGYGMTYGFERLMVREVTYASSDLPAAFNGYRIVHFTDAHVGTYDGSRSWMLRRMVDRINAQHADAVVFTGDLENLSPEDLDGKLSELSRIWAPDGVFSVLGNHDYAIYRDVDDATRERDNLRTQQLERQMGWQLLMNEHRVIRRDSDSIVIAGMENWGKVERMPRLGDVGKTLAGIDSSALRSAASGDSIRRATGTRPFVIMLQHDPSCWREKILPECHAQLTLSGHTHGGQFSLFGWSPVALSSSEWGGFYYEGDRALFVSTGVGGLIPFRLNMSGEIVVVTLRVKSEE